MNKNIISAITIAIAITFLSCNNPTETTQPSLDVKSDTVTTSKGFKWSEKDETLFYMGCFAKAKDQIGPQKADTYCACMFKELEKLYPDLDSSISIWNNEALLSELVERCRQ